MATTELSGESVRPDIVDAPFDPHGIEPVPTSDRTSSGWDQFWIWAGGNQNPINWVLGALGITLGLSFVETVAVIVVGNLVGCTIFATFCLMGHRTGVNQMVLARSAFGRRGGYVPSVIQLLLTMGWVGVNTWIVLDLAVAALGELGIDGGRGLEYVVAFLIMVAQVAIAVWGYYLIRTFERITVPITAVVMVAMTVLAFTRVDVNFTTSQLSGGDKFTAITQLMTAIGIGWGISWLVYASDYTRFSSPASSERKVFWSTFAGMFIPTVWLAILGAGIASSGSGTDPSQLVFAAFGVMALPVLFVILHGALAVNILNVYSCGLAAGSADMKIKRWKVSLTAGIVASVVVVVLVESDNFAKAFDNWMISLIVWISPWAAITLVNFFHFRRGRVDVAELYASSEHSAFGDINWRAMTALVLGLIAGWSWQYGLVEVMQGPIATVAGNTDFSWLTGGLVAGGAYFLLERRHLKRHPAEPVERPLGEPLRARGRALVKGREE